MSDAVTLKQRILQLKKAQANIPQIFSRVSEDATKRAVEATQDATPPKAGTGRGPYIGTNAVTGEAKAHWATDSRTTPIRSGEKYITTLSNNLEYISFLNDGHRMDRHFVPGLYVNPDSGLLEYDPQNKKVGIIVGTKTRYVKGEFMVDKGKETYRQTVLAELEKEVQKLLK